MSTSNLKISIAALSLCVSAVAIYIHLPYVIAAVSGSGAIEVVPLAIFTVSAIVALASAIYLIRLAAGEKPAKQESQTEVDSGTSSQHKSSVPTSPSQSPQTCDSVPPPPPPPPAPNSNGTSLPKRDAFLKEIEQGMKLISKEERDERLKEQAAKKSSNKGDGQKEKKEQAERREKQEKVNSKMQDPSALSIKEKAKMFGNWW
ncbi:MAG: hypothetical protein ACEY3L_10190 [Wolbachia sp.]